MVYKQILIPDENNHSIEMPEQFFGRKVEVIVVDVDSANNENYALPPAGKVISVSELLEEFGTAPDFPPIEEIRKKAWPSKW